jgi:hypothetical protein
VGGLVTGCNDGGIVLVGPATGLLVGRAVA